MTTTTPSEHDGGGGTPQTIKKRLPRSSAAYTPTSFRDLVRLDEPAIPSARTRSCRASCALTSSAVLLHPPTTKGTSA
jgi:hypothetical protein